MTDGHIYIERGPCMILFVLTGSMLTPGFTETPAHWDRIKEMNDI